MALTAPETTFITTHQTPVVVGMKPYLRQDQYLATGKPVCTVMPVITGTPAVGQVLSCSTGTWLNSPTFTYQWRRSGVPIAGATASTYTLVTADAGMRISCVVTGTAGGSSVSVAAHGLTIAVPFAGPSATILSPVDNLIGEPMMADLIATFDVPVTLGSGLVYLKKTTDGSVVASWNAAYAGSSPGRMEVVGGNAMTMHMLTPLTSGVEYYVTWDRGIVVDASANPAAALISTTAWSFVAAIPVASPEVYLDFAANTSLVNGTPGTAAALLTTTRAGTAYADNLAGVWTSFLGNVARITNKGLLVEEARSNFIRNNAMVGAVPGTPGTLPTNWLFGGLAGLASQVVGTGVDQGIDYIDIRFFGTTTGAQLNCLPEATTQIAATPGQVWDATMFIKLVAGSLTNVGDVRLYAIARNAGGANIGFTATPLALLPTAAWQRYEIPITLPALSAFASSSLVVDFASGVAIDMTLRIGWPQLELGAFATSPIRTIGAGVARAADVVKLTAPPAFGSAWTMYGAATSEGNVVATNAFLFDAYIDANNRGGVFRSTTANLVTPLLFVGGSLVYQPVGPAWSPNVASKTVMAIASGNYGSAFNGTLLAGGVVASYYTPTIVSLGTHFGDNAQWNGYITQAAIWANARLSNAQLQQISSVGVTP